MTIPFEHRHAGHCESGVISSLLRQQGLDLSEPMVLGLSAGLTFVHVPFVRVDGLPLTSYRMPPGAMVKGLAKAIGYRVHRERFGNPEKGGQALDAHLAAGRAVGVQTGVFWLPYFPDNMRFHFNAHNLIVYGRENGEYLISDPVFEHVQRCPAPDLARARFARGALAPKGLLYYPENVPGDVDLARLVPRAIRKTAHMMLRTPVPIIGVWAIRRLAEKIRAMPNRTDPRRVRRFVAQIVRMQEEIGTGGGGFRFMYAAFLQEAGERLGNTGLLEASAKMTQAGDAWRSFALASARYIKDKTRQDTGELAQALRDTADREETVYRDLLKVSSSI
jgi:hypothetical protein